MIYGYYNIIEVK